MTLKITSAQVPRTDWDGVLGMLGMLGMLQGSKPWKLGLLAGMGGLGRIWDPIEIQRAGFQPNVSSQPNGV